MTITSEDELNTLREGGRRLARVLAEVVRQVRPGVATKTLDEIAERLILSSGGSPIFKGYRSKGQGRPFPSSICTSLNDEVVHAIPRLDCILKEGNILGLDVGMRWPARQLPATSYQLPARRKLEAGGRKLEAGLITDMAVTVAVGKISAEAEKLLRVTRQALEIGIKVLRLGIRMGDLGYAIQNHIEEQGFGVIRELVGHGVGCELHEAPNIPNFGTPGQGLPIREGMVLAIEPMATMGHAEVLLGPDGWTWRTRDGSLAAHFEHTVVVTKDGAEVLTRIS